MPARKSGRDGSVPGKCAVEMARPLFRSSVRPLEVKHNRIEHRHVRARVDKCADPYVDLPVPGHRIGGDLNSFDRLSGLDLEERRRLSVKASHGA